MNTAATFNEYKNYIVYLLESGRGLGNHIDERVGLRSKTQNHAFNSIGTGFSPKKKFELQQD